MNKPEPCDLAILTVIRVELDQMLKAFTSSGSVSVAPVKVPGDGCSYWKARLHSLQEDRELNIVIGNVARAGLVASALRTVRFLQDYAPAMIILAGIAAGWKEKLKIGDVIWPRKVLDLSESEARDGKFVSRPNHHALPPEVGQMMQEPWFDKPALEAGTWRILGGRLQIPAKNKRQFAKEVASEPTVHDGVIACGDILVRDGDKFTEWQGYDPQVCAFEMEAAGMVRALEQRQRTLPWLVVRGVSDFGDHTKRDNQQPYAAAAVAAYVHQFAERGFDSRMLLGSATPPSPSPVSVPTTPSVAVSASVAQTVVFTSSEASDLRASGNSAVLQRWERIREEWTRDRSNLILAKLQALREDTQFISLASTVRAQVLRFEADVKLSLKDVEGAKTLAAQANILSPQNRALEARILARDGDARVAAERLNAPVDLEEWNTRMNLLLQAGDARGVLDVFEQAPEGIGPDAESYRLKTLALITTKEVARAEQTFEKVKHKRTDAFAFRLTGALLDYFRTLSPGAPEAAYSLMPNPVPLALVKRDEASLVALNHAAGEFAALAGVVSSGTELHQELRHWQLAALANNIAKQGEAATLCAELLASQPSDALAVGWSTVRNFDTDSNAQLIALAAELNVQL